MFNILIIKPDRWNGSFFPFISGERYWILI